MFSEFEVPKPNTEFNQIYLDNQEVFIETIKVTLEISKTMKIAGFLHLTTRSLVFQPKEESVQLIKIKFCDGLTTKSGKFSLQHVMKDLKKVYENYLKGMKRIINFANIKNDSREKKYGGSFNNQKKNKLLVKCNKFVIYERNPPTPFTVEILTSYFIFKIDKNNNYSSDQEDPLIKFEKLIKRVKECDDEDLIIDKIFAERYNKYKTKIKKKKNIEFIYPCKIIQTFENFYGAIYLSDKKKVKLVALLNKTKDINFKFSVRDIKWLTIYDYFYEKVGVEIFFFSRSLSYLITFENEKRAEKVYKKLKSLAYELIDVQLDSLTKTWTKNLMTNYDYLMYLNRLSNRSFNDITRYPIFPWIISDYSNDELKINNKYQYRDFALPIGTISEASKKKAKKYYKYLKNDPLPIKKPFHFHSYISNPGYIIFFYMRAIPSLILKLQSGAFGPNDRIFRSFESLWNSMHSGLTQFTELIPEFYSLNKSHIFLNKFSIDLGVNSNGEEINDVSLARWASGIDDFMFKNKSVLESEHCSLNLHKWINLVFGDYQRGEKAIGSCNVFNESCYKEFIENKGNNKLKNMALKLQIAEYGQLPNQLFTFEHPKKKIKAQIVLNNNSNNISKNKNLYENNKDETENDGKEFSMSKNSNDILNKLRILKENFEASDIHDIHQLNSQNNELDEDFGDIGMDDGEIGDFNESSDLKSDFNFE